MRSVQLIQTLVALVPTRQPLYLWGPPGIGKSQCVKQAAQAMGRRLIDLRAVLLDPVDLRGLPVPNGDVVHWKPAGFLPLKGRDNGGPGIIFADELDKAAPLVQAAFLQGILDHKIGETELDPEWVWVAASNRAEDRAGSHRIITPLLNRFIHIDLEISNEDWKAWALEHEVSQEVISFLDFKPGLLHDFQPSAGQRAFPTPRSWEFASKILPHVPADSLFEVVKGTVGEGAAAEFCAFVKTYRNLPDVDALLARPGSFKLPDDPAVLYALVGAITHRARSADQTKLNNIATVATAMQSDFSMLLMRDCLTVANNIKKAPAAKDWLTKNKKLVLSGLTSNG